MPQNHTNPHPIAVLGGLTLSQGKTTARHIKSCAICAKRDDLDLLQAASMIVVDADAEYDPIALTQVIIDQTSEKHRCNECGDEGPDDYVHHAYNHRAVASILDDLALVASLPDRIDLGMQISGRDPASGRTEIYQCEHCSSTEVSWDSYAYTNPITGGLWGPQTFQPYCSECDDDRAHLKDILCSAHEEIEFNVARRRRAKEARQQVKDIFDWINVAGLQYGIDADMTAQLRLHYEKELATLTAIKAPA